MKKRNKFFNIENFDSKLDFKNMSTVYGPPSFFEKNSPVSEKSSDDESCDDDFEPMGEIPVDIYGPPPVDDE